MKITRKEYQNIRYVCKKFNISPESVNLKKLAASLDKRLLKRRVITGFGLKQINYRSFVVYQSIKRIDLRKHYCKSDQPKNQKKLSWRKAVRRARATAKSEPQESEEITDEPNSPTQEVRSKLKEQLQLLQLGKKKGLIQNTSPLNDSPESNTENILEKPIDHVSESMHLESVDDTDEMATLRVTPSLEITNNAIEAADEIKKVKLESKDTLLETETIKAENEYLESNEKTGQIKNDEKSPSVTPNKGFLDLLLHKFKQSGKKMPETTEDEMPDLVKSKLEKVRKSLCIDSKVFKVEMPQEEEKTSRMRRRKPVHKIKEDPSENLKDPLEIRLVSDDSSPTEFFGFDEAEIPGLLPTPKVNNTIASAFIDSENISDIDVKLEKLGGGPTEIDKNEHDGMVCVGSKPPTLERPMRLSSIEKPRTVFQKRKLMQRKKGIKFLMMENESKIYNELAKINREDYDFQFNFPMLNALQKETVPYRRDAWRALCWLKTEKNRYLYKVIYVDGIKCNLLGSRGNFDGKKKFKTTSTPLPKYVEFKSKLRHPNLRPITIPRYLKINLTIPDEVETEPELEPVIVKKLLDFDKTIQNSKPGPLCAKIQWKCKRDNTDECLGPVELYEMPTVELEVLPQLGRPLDPKVLPYLKYLLPHEQITERWARFSVSLLKAKGKDIENNAYTFPVPYVNNQSKVMVRRRKEMDYHSTDSNFTEILEKPLSFTKNIDPDDELGQEIGQILTGITNTVAIGLSENCFIKDDPDLAEHYTKIESSIDKISPSKPARDLSLSRKVVRELKKLNATFIEADNQIPTCSESYCEKGCLCESLSTSLVYRNHCKRQECMLECVCSTSRIPTNEEIKDCNITIEKPLDCSFTNDEVQSLREKATAKLARVEKDFTPTLVLSNNSTYLIPSDRDNSRRSKKAPARYNDYVDPAKALNLQDEPTSDIVPLTQNARKKLLPKDPYEAALYDLRHVNVVLRPLQHVTAIEPWCMIHNLYKCFCHGRATEGRPFTFHDLDEDLEERFDYSHSRKRKYVFERGDTPEPETIRRRSVTLVKEEKPDPVVLDKSSSMDSSIDLSSFSTEVIDTDFAQRCNPVDEKYITRSPEKIRTLKESVLRYESKNPLLSQILQNRLEKCEKYFQDEMNKQKNGKQESSNQIPDKNVEKPNQKPKHLIKFNETVSNEKFKVSIKSEEVTVSSEIKDKPFVLEKCPIRLNIKNSLEEVKAISLLKPLVEKNVILITTGKNKIFAKKDLFYSGKLDFSKVIDRSKNTIFIIEKTPEAIANNPDFIKLNPYIRSAKTVDISQVINIVLEPESETVRTLENECREANFKEEEARKRCEENLKVMEHRLNEQRKLAYVNAMISRAMQYICNIERRNTKHLIEPAQSKMYFFRWKFMLIGFQQNLLSVWEIKCNGGKHAVVVTLKDVDPLIENLEAKINIKQCTANNVELSLFSKMLLLRVDGDRTKNLSLILYGGPNFWRVTGFANSNIDYIENGVAAKPTPESHPNASRKINNFYQVISSTPKFNKQKRNIRPENEQGSSRKKIKYETNIEVCAADRNTLKSLFLPIPQIGEHRWFMLQLAKDFSDIFIPAWNSYLTYDKIAYALSLAQKHNKTVRVTINEKFPEIYATPNHLNKIFFGPYRLDESIDYVLCQNFDGEIISREEYEEKVNIRRKNTTKGSWLYIKRNSNLGDGPSKNVPEIIDTDSKPNTSDAVEPSEPMKVPSPLPFLITSVQTVTDPNFIPIDDDPEDESVPTADQNESTKQPDKDVVPGTTFTNNEDNNLAANEIVGIERINKKPIKLTICRKRNSDDGAYTVKTMSITGSSPKKIATDMNLTGRRISLPISAVKTMTPVASLSNMPKISVNSNLSKQPIKESQLKNAQPKPSTFSASEKILDKVKDNPKPPVIITINKIDTKSTTPSLDKIPVQKPNRSLLISSQSSATTSRTSNQLQDLRNKLPASISLSVQTKANTVFKQPEPIATISKPPLQPPIAISNTRVETAQLKKAEAIKVQTNGISKTTDNIDVHVTKKTITKGYFISGFPSLGRILAEKSDEAVLLTMKNSEGIYVKRHFVNGNAAAQYLNGYFKSIVYAVIPENFVVQWMFEVKKDKYQEYPDHDPNKMTRKLVITRFCAIDLGQSWEDFNYLEKIDKNLYLKLLILKLADECFPKTKLKSDALAVLRTSKQEIDGLKSYNQQLLQKYTQEESRNKLLSEKIEQLKLMFPNIDIPAIPRVTPKVEPTPSTSTGEPQKNSPKMNKGIEVICLDD